jgi:hypothetical protein
MPRNIENRKQPPAIIIPVRVERTLWRNMFLKAIFSIIIYRLF